MVRVRLGGTGRWLPVFGITGAFIVSSCGLLVAQQTGVTVPNQAEAAAGPQSSPQALADYAKAANFQNNGAFDLAVEAWQSFLGAHPQDPKAVDARYHLGVCQLQLKNYPQAREAFQAAVDANVPFDRREDALLNLGWTLYSLALKDQPQLFPQADQAFDTLLREFPEGQYRDQALFFRGESLYLQAKRQEAAAAYQQVVDNFPQSDLREDALYALGVTWEELGKHDVAGPLYDRFLEEYPGHELANEVKMRRADTILYAQDFADAARRFAEVAAVPGFSSADYALYRQAFCLARLDKFDEAGNLFARITREFPQSSYLGDAAISAARMYFRAEKLDLAAEWFDKVIAAQDQHTIEAVHWRARLWLKQQQPDQALALVAKYLPQAQEHPYYVNLLMDQADAIYELPAQRAKAIPLYAELAEQFPRHVLAPQALYNAAFGAMQLKDFPQGLQYAQKFIQNFASHQLLTDVQHVAAECQLQSGNAQAAADLFGQLARNHPDREESAQWLIREALALYMQQKYEAALQRLEGRLDLMKKADDRAEADYVIGMSHFARNEFLQAKDALQKSLDAQPQWRQADETLLILARAQRELKEIDAARQSVERLLHDFPESAVRDQAHFRLAECAYAQGDFATAVEQNSHVIQDWPQSSSVPYALYGRGWARLRMEQNDPAEADFSQLIKQFPDSPLARQAYYARALCRQQKGAYAESLTDVDAFLQTDPSRQKRSDALYVRGLDQIGLGQPDQAQATLESIIRDDSEYVSLDKVLYELAWSLKNRQQEERAAEVFEQLIQQRSDSPLAAEAAYHVGEEAYRKGQFDRAAELYQQALRDVKEPSELVEKAWYKLGWARYQLQKYEDAIQAFQQQLQLQPEGTLAGDAFFLQGECHFKLQNHQLALASFKEATRRSLSSPQMDLLARLHAGQTAGQMGQWQESLQWLNELPQKYADSPYRTQVLFETGVAHQQLGDWDQAYKLFNQAAEQATGELSARARFMVGEVLYARKDYAPAIREFRKVLFGFDSKASPEIQQWQAKAGLEAGQCAALIASQQTDANEKKRLLDLARQLLMHVQNQFPSLPEAVAAGEQLKRYGG